jgi:hypothetical protein
MYIIDGKILYTPIFSFNTYLIDSNGVVVNTWHSNYLPALSAYVLPNGNILRPTRFNIQQGGGGGLEEYNSQGDLIWCYEYYLAGKYQSHHDIEPLSNGNILMLTWEYKNETEVISAGRNPDLVNGLVAFEHVIEVQPTSQNTGDIVWEWHSFDHLIQDYDTEKNNYGIVADHPELLDINYCHSDHADLLHCNSIDYNEHLDQILISCKNSNEIWIIDHNITTEQAAGHTGGRYGKGGDILYRWGNPQAYRVDAPCKFYRQHDATWIDIDCPGAGNILVFNNGAGRGYSSIDEIIPPVNSSGFYEYTPGSAYAPNDSKWSYTSPGFYSSLFSSAQRLRSGNTLICDGMKGNFFEVAPSMDIVWQYNVTGKIFKIAYIYPVEQNDSSLYCSGSLSFSKVKLGATVLGNFQVTNSGGSLLNWSIESYPSWGNWTFSIINGSLLAEKNVIVNVTIVAPIEKQKFIGAVKIIDTDNSSNFCEIDVYLQTPRIKVSYNSLLIGLFERFLILRHLVGL